MTWTAPKLLIKNVIITNVMAMCKLCEERQLCVCHDPPILHGNTPIGIERLSSHLRTVHNIEVCDVDCRHCKMHPLFAKDVKA